MDTYLKGDNEEDDSLTRRWTRDDVIYTLASADNLRTWRNSGNDAQYYIYIMQYGQYIDSIILK